MRLHERHARALDRVGDDDLRALGSRLEQLVRASRERREVVAVAARRTAQPNDATFCLESPRSLTVRHPGVRLQLVVVDDHGDLARALVRGRLQRLPDLPLLQLAVAGQHEDASAVRPASRSASTNPCAFEMPMPSEPVLVDDLRRRCDVGMARQAAEAAQR